MTTFKVQGGNKLKGEINPQGAKNETTRYVHAKMVLRKNKCPAPCNEFICLAVPC